MIGTSISSAVRVGEDIDIAQARPRRASTHGCHLCDLTPLGHGLLPIAGALLAFFALVFGCR